MVSRGPFGEISPDGATDLLHFAMVSYTDGAFPVISEK